MGRRLAVVTGLAVLALVVAASDADVTAGVIAEPGAGVVLLGVCTLGLLGWEAVFRSRRMGSGHALGTVVAPVTRPRTQRGVWSSRHGSN